MKKITEATPDEKVIALAEIDGGIWIYNRNAEKPHRFFLGRNSSISHYSLFQVWDGMVRLKCL